MNWADWLMVLMTVEAGVVAVAYVYLGDYPRFVYWASVVSINLAILNMGASF